MEYQTLSKKFEEMLASRGVTRRGFLQLCGTVAAAAGVSRLTVPDVAQALEESIIGAAEGNLYPVIWIEGASCTGCTEAFAQIDEPDPATVVLEMISCNYNETLSFAAGHSVEEAKAQTIKQCAGNYVLVYEGALLEGWDGYALRVADTPGIEAFAEAAESAFGVVALGSCAVNGGWMGAHPDPAGAIGCQAFMKKRGIETPVVNIPGCPANPEWLVAVLVDVVLMGVLPELNSENKPALIFDQTVHDNCQRRGHFENGEFVYKFGSVEERRGYCLYPLGCRGPQTKANCGVVRYNRRRSWCVESGAPCVGCCEADPNNTGHNWVEVNTPFYERHRDLRIGNWVFQPRTVALGLTGIVAAAVAIHGFGIKKSGRMKGAFRFEEQRAWDAKNPDNAIGDYNAERTIIHEDGHTEAMSASEFAQKEATDYENILQKLGARVSEKIEAAKEDVAEKEHEAEAALADAAEAVDTVETVEVVETVETVEAVETAETVETVETVEVVETAETVEAVEAAEAAEAAETAERVVDEAVDAAQDVLDETKGGQE